MKRIIPLCMICAAVLFASCQQQTVSQENKTENNMKDWKTELTEKLPLMGHRNWIVVTDMAYPLQTKPGIITLMAEETYAEVIGLVNTMIQDAPHVFAHIYQDQEQQSLSEALAPGWDDYKSSLSKVPGLENVTYVPHEELILRLDEVSQLYQVIIIKTRLTIPYTSTFFELDCNYWDAEREGAIRKM